MSNSQWLEVLFSLLEKLSNNDIVGACVDRFTGSAAISIDSKDLSKTFQTMMVATGMDRFMTVSHCEETELCPEMDYFYFDLNAMDSVRISAKGQEET